MCPIETRSKLSAKGTTVKLNSCGKHGIKIIKDVNTAAFSQ